MNDDVIIFEVGPRDGLQNEKQHIETKDKIKLVNMLSECGFKKIEVTSFVSPKWVPQMADAAQVMAAIARPAGRIFAALVPNLRGFEAAQAAGVDEVAVFASASEGFSQNNINCSIAQSLARFAPVLEAAQAAGLPVRGYVSCVVDCPYDGPTAPGQAADVAAALVGMGCYEISLGDTLGHATPSSISAMLETVIQQVPARLLAGHYHDTKHHALANISASLDAGLRVFDSSVAGLGGCPYAPGAKGNVATEAVVEMLHAKGFETGIDPVKLAAAAKFAAQLRSPQ